MGATTPSLSSSQMFALCIMIHKLKGIIYVGAIDGVDIFRR